MKDSNIKAQQLKDQGHSIFSIGESEIWYTDRDDGKLRCIYKKKILTTLKQ